MSFVEAFVRLAKASARKRKALRGAEAEAASLGPFVSDQPGDRPVTQEQMEQEKARATELARLTLTERLESRRIPRHMWEDVIDYALYGMPLGSDSFLRNVLSNNLVRSIGKADEQNKAAIFDWAMFLYNDMPVGSWGDAGRIQNWQGTGGLIGRMFPKEKGGA